MVLDVRMRLRKKMGRIKKGYFVVCRFMDHAGGTKLAPIIAAGVVRAIDADRIVLDHWADENDECEVLDQSAIDRRTISDLQAFDVLD
jgi:hypothetical protein